MSHKLLVYGTLKKGRGNYRRLEEAGIESFLGNAVLHNHEMFSLGGFPGVRPKKGSKVIGELYVVRSLGPTDMLEGHPDFYRRTPVEVVTDEGKVECETYILEGYGSNAPIVESGEW
jgi:gamma-glutamylcyclotransferase (GGCT)/AIG2-like uncharacterized protein YtfP